jgi:hypothetical protein
MMRGSYHAQGLALHIAIERIVLCSLCDLITGGPHATSQFPDSTMAFGQSATDSGRNAGKVCRTRD